MSLILDPEPEPQPFDLLVGMGKRWEGHVRNAEEIAAEREPEHPEAKRVRLQAQLDAANGMFDGAMRDPQIKTPGTGGMDAARAWKKHLMVTIGAHLEQQFSAAELEEFDGWFKAEARGHPATTAQSVATRIITSWSESACDHRQASIAVQAAVRRVFGLDDSKLTRDELAVLNAKNPHYGETPPTKAVERILDAAVRFQYEATQQYLKDHGIEEVVLFRGTGSPKSLVRQPSAKELADGTFETIDSHPLSSWSSKIGEARNFTHPAGVMMTMSVPRERIYALPMTGAGCLREHEFIVLGGQDRARVQRTADFLEKNAGEHIKLLTAGEAVKKLAADPDAWFIDEPPWDDWLKSISRDVDAPTQELLQLDADPFDEALHLRVGMGKRWADHVKTDEDARQHPAERFATRDFNFSALGPHRRFLMNPLTGHVVFGGQDYFVTHAEEFADAQKADPSIPGKYDDYVKGSVDAQQGYITLLNLYNHPNWDRAQAFDAAMNVLASFVRNGAGKQVEVSGVELGRAVSLGDAYGFLFKKPKPIHLRVGMGMRWAGHTKEDGEAAPDWKNGREYKADDGMVRRQMRGFSGFKQTGSGPMPDEYEALLRYTNYGYRNLDAGDAKLLDTLIRRNTIDEDATLYRVIREKALTGYRVGDTFVEKGFTSTTWKMRAAQDIIKTRKESSDYGRAKRVIFKVHVRAGQPAFEVDQYEEHDEGMSFNEAEYLLPRKTTYRVTKVSDEGVIEEVEAIPAKHLSMDLSVGMGQRWAGHTKEEAADKFVEQVSALGYANPFNDYETVVDNEAVVEVQRFEDHVTLRTVRALAQKQGAGTRLMERLTQMADEAGVTLELDAVPLQTDVRIPKKKLIEFYQRFGFKTTGRTSHMVREPAPISLAVGMGMRWEGHDPTPDEAAPSRIPTDVDVEHLTLKLETVPRTEGIQAAEEAWAGGVADFGDPEAATLIQEMPGYRIYRSEVQRAVQSALGDKFTVWRAMTRATYEAFEAGEESGPMAVSLSPDVATGWRKFAPNQGKEMVVVEFDVSPKMVVMAGKLEEQELVIDGDWVSFHTLRVRKDLSVRVDLAVGMGRRWEGHQKSENTTDRQGLTASEREAIRSKVLPTRALLEAMASGEGDVTFFHGTPLDRANKILTEGFKPLTSGEDAAKDVARIYDIPWDEWTAFIEERPGAGYGTETAKVSTGPYVVAASFAHGMPQGEVLSQLNQKARLYVGWKASGEGTTKEDYENWYEKAVKRAQEIREDVSADDPRVNRRGTHDWAGFLGLPDKMAPETGMAGAVLAVTVPASVLEPRIREQAERTLRLLDRIKDGTMPAKFMGGAWTEQEVFRDWIATYQDIKVDPKDVKRISHVLSTGEVRRAWTPETGSTTLPRHELSSGHVEGVPPCPFDDAMHLSVGMGQRWAGHTPKERVEILHIDYAYGENIYVARVKDANDKIVGQLDYSIYRDEIVIKNVEVDPEVRRQGVATALYDAVREANPGLPLTTMGFQTPEGVAFRDAYDASRGIVEWKPVMTPEESEKWVGGAKPWPTSGSIVVRDRNADAILREGFKIGEHKNARTWGEGVYVGLQPDSAKFYRGWKGEGVDGEGTRTFVVRVNLKNPVLLTDKDVLENVTGPNAMVSALANKLGAAFSDPFAKEWGERITVPEFYDPHAAPVKHPDDDEARSIAQGILRDMGYDGIVIQSRSPRGITRGFGDGENEPHYSPGWSDAGGDQIVAFDPKSVVIVGPAETTLGDDPRDWLHLAVGMGKRWEGHAKQDTPAEESRVRADEAGALKRITSTDDYGEQKKIRNAATKRVARTVGEQFSAARLEATLTAMRPADWTFSPKGMSVGEQLLDELSWAWLTGSHDLELGEAGGGKGMRHPEVAALRQAAQDEFGVVAPAMPPNWKLTQADRDKVSLLKQPEHQEVFRAVLRATYDETQRQLAKAGIDHVTIFRGTSTTKMAGGIAKPALDEGMWTTIKPGVVTSWSVTAKGGGKFAREHSSGNLGVLWAVRVPRERVLAIPTSGLGSWHEDEVLLLGSKKPLHAFGFMTGRYDITAEDVEAASQKKHLSDPFDLAVGMGQRWAGHTATTDAPLAERIAREAHATQLDKQGVAYIEHVSRVVASVSDAAKPVAWLHDTIEDTPHTRESLLAEGVSAQTLDSVHVLTRQPAETYSEFIARIAQSGDPVAVEVKLADLRDNLRAGGPESLRQRYEKAIEQLEPRTVDLAVGMGKRWEGHVSAPVIGEDPTRSEQGEQLAAIVKDMEEGQKTGLPMYGVLGMPDMLDVREVHAYLKDRATRHPSQPLPAGYKRGEPKDCYRNATLLMMTNPSLRYAEGIAYAEFGLPFLHAWCVDPDGKVVDPTWEHPEKCTYTGVIYDRKPYLAHVMKSKFYGVIGGNEKDAVKVIKRGGLA